VDGNCPGRETLPLEGRDTEPVDGREVGRETLPDEGSEELLRLLEEGLE
jgi:hypothetical protein